MENSVIMSLIQEMKSLNTSPAFLKDFLFPDLFAHGTLSRVLKACLAVFRFISIYVYLVWGSMLCTPQLHDRYKAASTITYCSVSLQQSPEWPLVEMKRIERDREKETEPVWTLCSAKSGSSQLVMEKFTLCFSINRPVNLMS